MNFIVEADSVVVVYFLFVLWIQPCTASLVLSIHRPAAQPGILIFTVHVTPFLPVGKPVPIFCINLSIRGCIRFISCGGGTQQQRREIQTQPANGTMLLF